MNKDSVFQGMFLDLLKDTKSEWHRQMSMSPQEKDILIEKFGDERTVNAYHSHILLRKLGILLTLAEKIGILE